MHQVTSHMYSNDEYTQASKGFINFKDLSIDLVFDEWIGEQMYNTVFKRVDNGIHIAGFINAENSTMGGTGGNRAFDVELDR